MDDYYLLRYCGTVDFAPGVWVGVELDSAEGKNDGIIQDIVYFKCSPRHGLFVPLNRVSKFPSSCNLTPPPSASGSCSNSSSSSTGGHRQGSPKSLPSHLPSSGKAEEFRIGDRVTVTMLNGVRHAGTIRFRGETKFASGLWYGVELDNPEGRNGGSVQGVKYFSCPAKHGLFATASKLQKIMQPAKSTNTLARRSSLNLPTTRANTMPRRSLSTKHRSNSTTESPTQPPKSLPK